MYACGTQPQHSCQSIRSAEILPLRSSRHSLCCNHTVALIHHHPSNSSIIVLTVFTVYAPEKEKCILRRKSAFLCRIKISCCSKLSYGYGFFVLWLWPRLNVKLLHCRWWNKWYAFYHPATCKASRVVKGTSFMSSNCFPGESNDCSSRVTAWGHLSSQANNSIRHARIFEKAVSNFESRSLHRIQD